MKPKILTEKFYRQNTTEVAKKLLGKYLVIDRKNEKNKLMITETEAYLGEKDKASHSYSGKTERNKVMFGPPGKWYVYLIYGIHDMLNIVTEQQGIPKAVLIRAAGEFDGPGKLTKALDINRDYNGKRANPKTGLWIEDQETSISESKIKSTPRIGVDYAEEWAKKPLRFVLT
ncbi:MAG: 3-methyladenine DNA glycosylase [Parcubacteria group bacterium QH_9_35_7]|nr:MAG: 3-methyladenine DNA glycosylase [Parcubacteria group bacterium QH_9_35_7]